MEVVVGGRRVPYLLRGSRPDTIVFLPALGTTSAMWSPQIGKYAHRYTVVVPEFGGHDRLSEPITLETLAADLAAVLNAVGSTWVHIVGISLGGMIAQRFALENPDRTRSLVLINTTCRYTDAGRQSLLDRAALVEREGMEAVVDTILDRWFTDTSFEDGSLGCDTILGMLLSADARAYAATARAAASVDTSEELPEIAARTLIVRAEGDSSMPPEAAMTLKERIPRSKIASLPHLAHLCTAQAPNTFNALLDEFLEEVEEESVDDLERTEPAHPW
jgi:pimeloyl-ACP methyl ester carboxylesterase